MLINNGVEKLARAFRKCHPYESSARNVSHGIPLSENIVKINTEILMKLNVASSF